MIHPSKIKVVISRPLLTKALTEHKRLGESIEKAEQIEGGGEKLLNDLLEELPSDIEFFGAMSLKRFFKKSAVCLAIGDKNLKENHIILKFEKTLTKEEETQAQTTISFITKVTNDIIENIIDVTIQSLEQANSRLP